MNSKSNVIIYFGVFLLFMSLITFTNIFFKINDKNIWWTPNNFALTVEQAKDKVHIFIKNKPIGRYNLYYKQEDNSMQTIEINDITMRFNNYDSVRADSYFSGMVNAFFAGAGIVLIAVGLFFRKYLS